MRRRHFIALVCAAAVRPIAARAQPSGRLPRIVFLHGLAEDDPEVRARIVAFREGLQALGWLENRNIRVEHRFSAGDASRIEAEVAALMSAPPDVIVASSTPVLAALKRATSTIPIVFSVVNDPVGQGFIASFARPGANITGFTFVDFALIGKWVDILKEVVPGLRRVALMFNPETAPYYPVFLREFEAAAAQLAKLSPMAVRSEADIGAALAAFARQSGGAVIAAPDPFINARRGLVMSVAAKLNVPVIYGFRLYVIEGALVSYGPDTLDIVRRSAGYVDRILRGEKPGQLPAQAPTKFELVFNLKTAKALGVRVPETLLARADEVIE